MPANAAAAEGAGVVAGINARNAWRVLPLLVAGYVVNTLDKTNIGFAALEMNKALGLAPEIFGFGAGLFFVSYTLFEVPSNLLIRRFGPRAWLSRILISWGLVSMAMALTYDKESFYALRLLLGVAEAGWYPGVLFYLSSWFPREYRARALMWFFMGSPAAAILGSPLSGALLGLPPGLGLAGWQWLFIVEGLPAVVLGVMARIFITNSPDEARWLTPAEKNLLHAAISRGRDRPARGASPAARPGVLRTLSFAVINFFSAFGLYSTYIWMPTVIKGAGHLTNTQTGLVFAVPFVFAAIALIVCSSSSDRIGERKWHVAAMFLAAAAAMAAASASAQPALKLLFLTLSMMGAMGVQGTFFALVSEGLDMGAAGGASLAASLAVVTTIGNLGGFVGPSLIGHLMPSGADTGPALLVIAAAFAAAGLVVGSLRPAILGTPGRASAAAVTR